MARARLLKPSFFKNEELADLGPLARLLFSGLWCLADREGRLEDRPRKIKTDVLPYDDCNVDELLALLDEHGFICRYEAGGHRYLQVINFLKHQQPHYKESLSEIPAPPGHDAPVVVTTGVPREQRDRIMARDAGTCRACGSTERPTIDHIVPRSKGGSGTDDNLQVLCHRCNSSKNNREASATSTQARPDVESTLDEANRLLTSSSSSSSSGLNPGTEALTGSLGPGPERAREAPPPPPESLQEFHSILAKLPGYEPSAQFYAKIAEKYGRLDLVEEALRISSWCQSQPRGPTRCSTGFVLKWLKKSEDERIERGKEGNGHADRASVSTPGRGTQGHDRGGRARGRIVTDPSAFAGIDSG